MISYISYTGQIVIDWLVNIIASTYHLLITFHLSKNPLKLHETLRFNSKLLYKLDKSLFNHLSVPLQELTMSEL